ITSVAWVQSLRSRIPPASSGTRVRGGVLECRLASDQVAEDDAGERGTFEHGRDDNHGDLNAGRDFRLTGHAFQSGRADPSQADAGANDRQTHANTRGQAGTGK